MSQRNWTTIKEYEDIRFEFFEGIAKITICIGFAGQRSRVVTKRSLSHLAFMIRAGGRADAKVGVVDYVTLSWADAGGGDASGASSGSRSGSGPGSGSCSGGCGCCSSTCSAGVISRACGM